LVNAASDPTPSSSITINALSGSTIVGTISASGGATVAIGNGTFRCCS
jgi:hypothetical protein